MITVATTPPTGYVRVDISLDWNKPGHYDHYRELPCRICRQATALRDHLGEPAHKTCVEGEIEAKVLAFAQSLLPVAVEQPARRPARARQTGQQRVVRGRRTAVAS